MKTIIKSKSDRMLYEPLRVSAWRFDMTEAEVKEHLGRELAYVYDPKKNLMVVAGCLPTKEEKMAKELDGGWRNPLVSLMKFAYRQPKDAFEFCVWLFFGWLLIPLGIIMLILDCFFTLLGEMYDLHLVQRGKKKVVYFGGGTGDGFFDEVSTRRREEFQFLTGTGKYANDGY